MVNFVRQDNDIVVQDTSIAFQVKKNTIKNSKRYSPDTTDMPNFGIMVTCKGYTKIVKKGTRNFKKPVQLTVQLTLIVNCAK